MVRLLGLGIFWLLGCAILSANNAREIFYKQIHSSTLSHQVLKDTVTDSTQQKLAILRHQFNYIGWMGDLPPKFQQKANRKLFQISDTNLDLKEMEETIFI